MGLTFRKSLGFGLIRLNFSGSGVGMSFGVRGARVSMGPRGTFVHVGSNGLYYRQRVSGPLGVPSPARPIGQPVPLLERSLAESSATTLIESADPSQLIDASNQEILEAINSRIQIRGQAPVIWLLGIVLSAVVAALLLAPAGPEMAAASFVTGIFSTAILAWPFASGDRNRRTTPLLYELEGEGIARFTAITNACNELARAERLWRVRTTQDTWDWKRNAGASSLITRHGVVARRERAPYLDTNVEPWCIHCNDLRLFLLPDQMFVWNGRTYGAVSYADLQLDCATARFIEEESLPRDSAVVGYTWKFVRRDGGPDRRFNNNRELPIAAYGFLELTSSTGLNLHLQISSQTSAAAFAEGLGRARAKRFRERPVNYGNARDPNGREQLRTAFEILGVSQNASIAEIKAAFHRMATQYHPDKVASLGPELRELAHRRMTEINNAYAAIEAGRKSETSGSDAIVFGCPYCKKRLQVPYADAGKTRKCPECRRSVKAPSR